MLLTRARRALPALTLFIAFARSQTCYFSDGKTIASDAVPCSGNGTASSCCPSDSFCLDNGLCYGGGLVSRHSCTDATWDSPACAEYCKTESPDSDIGITACSSDADTNTFVCGLNTTGCQTDTNTFIMTGGSGLSLRADQVATLLQSVLSSPSETASATQVTVTVTPSATADPSGLYTRTNMVALGAGLGVPLFLALCFCGFMLLRERQKHAKPKLMYKLPDSCKDEFTFRPPPIPVSPYTASSVSDANSRASFRTTGSQKPEHQQSWLQRYETMAQRGQVHEKERHELDTGFAKELPRHELPDRRVSRDG